MPHDDGNKASVSWGVYTQQAFPSQPSSHEASASKGAAHLVSSAQDDTRKEERGSESRADKSRPRRVVITDASLLIYSLRTVHDLLKDSDTQVVIPSEAIATLDVLKKGEHILNLAARRATRFIEERIDGTSLILQPEHATIGRRRGTAGGQGGLKVSSHARHPTENPVMLDLEKDAPVAVRETLYCALYFMHQYDRREPPGTVNASGNHRHRPALQCTLAVALPPPHMDLDVLPMMVSPETKHHTAAGRIESSAASSARHTMRFAGRADGRTVMLWARRCGIDGEQLHVAPTAASWLAVPPEQLNRRM